MRLNKVPKQRDMKSASLMCVKKIAGCIACECCHGKEVAELYYNPSYRNGGIEKAATLDFDGPAAINNNFTGVGSKGFPIGVVIASTWNKDMAKEWGRCMGKICREMGAQGWYAPGMNTHRTAFGARNYEYFSEDGVLSGYMGANAVAAPWSTVYILISSILQYTKQWHGAGKAEVSLLAGWSTSIEEFKFLTAALV